MRFTDKDIDFMREDLESGMRYSEFIDSVRKRFEEEGRDFEAEFKEWQKKNAKPERRWYYVWRRSLRVDV
jgi:hypothetical protein